MKNTKIGSRDGLLEHLFWDLSFKNRKIILPILISIIIILGILLAKKYFALEAQIKELSSFKPIYVAAVNKNLHIGDLIRQEDISPMVYSKKEFTKILFHDPQDNLDKPALISCKLDPKTNSLIGVNDLVGRVVKFPILANSVIRKEYLAPINSLAGLENLLDENQSLIDIEVPQSGFNIFLRPGNKVDLLEVSNTGSKVINSNAEIILVDSKAIGEADFLVENKPEQKRNITLMVPTKKISEIAKVKKSQNLILTLSKSKTNDFVQETKFIQKPNLSPKTQVTNAFQVLTMILGAEKEIHGG